MIATRGVDMQLVLDHNPKTHPHQPGESLDIRIKIDRVEFEAVNGWPRGSYRLSIQRTPELDSMVTQVMLERCPVGVLADYLEDRQEELDWSDVYGTGSYERVVAYMRFWQQLKDGNPYGYGD